jgi:hypothetical protein
VFFAQVTIADNLSKTGWSWGCTISGNSGVQFGGGGIALARLHPTVTTSVTMMVAVT